MAQGKIGELIIVTGNAFKDAELKHIGDKGTTLCEFSLIVGKQEDGKGKFANCKAWAKLGEYAGQIVKGDTVCAVGTLESREYNGKTYTSLKVDWMNIIGTTGGAPQTQYSPNGTPYPAGMKFTDEEEDPNALPF